MQARFNTRGKEVRIKRPEGTFVRFEGQFRPVGAKVWQSVKVLGAVGRFYTAREANVAAIEHVGAMGGLCTHEGTPE